MDPSKPPTGDPSPSSEDSPNGFAPGRAAPGRAESPNSIDREGGTFERANSLETEVLRALESNGPADSPSRSSGGGATGKLAGVGLQFAGVVGLFTFGGHWLDTRLETEPWLLLTGLLLGLVGGGYSMVLKVQRSIDA